jgi:hypothetical protein
VLRAEDAVEAEVVALADHVLHVRAHQRAVQPDAVADGAHHVEVAPRALVVKEWPLAHRHLHTAGGGGGLGRRSARGVGGVEGGDGGGELDGMLPALVDLGFFLVALLFQKKMYRIS